MHNTSGSLHAMLTSIIDKFLHTFLFSFTYISLYTLVYNANKGSLLSNIIPGVFQTKESIPWTCCNF